MTRRGSLATRLVAGVSVKKIEVKANRNLRHTKLPPPQNARKAARKALEITPSSSSTTAHRANTATPIQAIPHLNVLTLPILCCIGAATHITTMLSADRVAMWKPIVEGESPRPEGGGVNARSG